MVSGCEAVEEQVEWECGRGGGVGGGGSGGGGGDARLDRIHPYKPIHAQ